MTENTTSMREAAVLLMNGCEMAAARKQDGTNRVIFQIAVPPEHEARAKDLLRRCRAGGDLDVHLGRYENALRQVRRTIDNTRGGRKHE